MWDRCSFHLRHSRAFNRNNSEIIVKKVIFSPPFWHFIKFKFKLLTVFKKWQKKVKKNPFFVNNFTVIPNWKLGNVTNESCIQNKSIIISEMQVFPEIRIFAPIEKLVKNLSLLDLFLKNWHLPLTLWEQISIELLMKMKVFCFPNVIWFYWKLFCFSNFLVERL